MIVSPRLRLPSLGALLVVLGLATLLPLRTQAQAPAPAGAVKVRVHVIHASKKAGPTDPEVQVLAKQLKNFGFKSFALHRVQDLTLQPGATGVVELPGARKLQITPLSRDATGKLKVRVVLEGVLDTTYTIKNGASILIGGPRHGDGTMVLAVTQTSG